jgi:hypothetical protein
VCCWDANVQPDEPHEDAICERHVDKSRRVEFPCERVHSLWQSQKMEGASGRATGTRDICDATSRGGGCERMQTSRESVPLTPLITLGDYTPCVSVVFQEAKQNECWG